MTERSRDTRVGAERDARWRRFIVVAALAAGVALAAVTVACGGGGKSKSGTETPSSTPTPGQNVGLQTPIAFSTENTLSTDDLAKRGTGIPGRGDFNGDRVVIASVGIDAPITYKAVGADGVMPNPLGPEDVAYYDFNGWDQLGGTPGKGGNIVIAGHVDYINYGPAVFWKLRDLQVGDVVTVRMRDGTEYNYKIEFNKQAPNDFPDWNAVVSATADESLTLITCTGDFEAGHYNRRQIAWGRRV